MRYILPKMIGNLILAAMVLFLMWFFLSMINVDMVNTMAGSRLPGWNMFKILL